MPVRLEVDSGSGVCDLQAPQAVLARARQLEDLRGALLVGLMGYAGHSTVRRFLISTRLEVIPNHACGVHNLHDRVVVNRGNRVGEFWPVPARGRVQ
jgi:D-serine deaminase-like pyridoxal phosphate-dependent protein